MLTALFVLLVWMCSGLKVRAVASGSTGFEPCPQDRCVVFLGKTLYSHSASLHAPGYTNGYMRIYAGGNSAMD